MCFYLGIAALHIAGAPRIAGLQHRLGDAQESGRTVPTLAGGHHSIEGDGVGHHGLVNGSCHEALDAKLLQCVIRCTVFVLVAHILKLSEL